MKFSTFTTSVIASVAFGMLALPPARADDIDIFIGSTSTAAAPNLIFLLDNSPNWARQAQHWPGGLQQGQSEVDAIVRVATQIYINRNGNPTANPPIPANPNAPSVNIGIAMLTTATPSPSPSGYVGGGYLRFAARDMTNLTNLTALANILGYTSPPYPLTAAAPSTSIFVKVQDPTEKINQASKDEDAGLYEVFKYFNSLGAFAGAASANPYADWSGHTVAQCPAGQGLPAPYALASNGNTYVSPSTSCSKQYIVYIANNAQGGAAGSLGLQSYETAYSAGTFLPYDPNWPSWTPAWVRFLSKQQITTYILDAFNPGPPLNPQTGQQNAAYSNSLVGAAKQAGPNNYYQVGNSAQILAALTQILADIQSVNSAFAATSLPASATNRSVDQNEVFLGVFRPDGGAKPRWYGNLKRFQLILNNGSPDLGDAIGALAINSTTGFLKDCAASFWTSDTSAYQPASTVTAQPYWSIVPEQPSPSSACPTAPTGVTNWSAFSDLPDGPLVEKGGAAEVLRRGNVVATATPTWQVSRTIKTLNGLSLVDFNSSTIGVTLTSLGTPATDTVTTKGKLVDYVQGWDSNDENGNTYTDPLAPSSITETRTSIHGDVIHSTPLPITYNANPGGVVVYYGSNDGMYHAVNATSGKEVWSFIAPEFFPRVYRLYSNSPQILYPNQAPPIPPTPAPTPKDYGFDGPTGLYQSADNSQIWIYPSMRRGGRMIYAFDVSPSGGNPPATPTFLWKAGCPDLGDDTGCNPIGMAGIGQTWSTPATGRIKNGPTDTVAAPVVVVGGGYDSTPINSTTDKRFYTSCEDQNTTSPSCSSRKGNAVYILDAHGTSGSPTLLKTLPLPSTNGTPGSVAGDVVLLDADGDGFVDYAYLSDTKGFVYRIDFSTMSGPTTKPIFTPLSSSNWAIHQIAGTPSNGRKFLFAPTLFFNQNKVYVGLGTGDREHPLISQYPYTTGSNGVLNRFYLFVDDPLVDLGSTGTFLNLDDTSKVEDATGATCDTAKVLPGNTAAPSSTTPVGWFLPMTANGRDEQVVTPAVIVAGQVSWGTNRPLPPSGSACTNQLGEARGYLVSLVNGSGSIGVTGLCGGSTSTPYAGGGLPPPPSVGVVQIPGVGGGPPTFIGTCIGCPPKGGGPGSTIQPGNPFLGSSEVRRRVFWSTAGDK